MTGDWWGYFLAGATCVGLGVTSVLSWQRYRQISEREAADKARRERIVAALAAFGKAAGDLADALRLPDEGPRR